MIRPRVRPDQPEKSSDYSPLNAHQIEAPIWANAPVIVARFGGPDYDSRQSCADYGIDPASHQPAQRYEHSDTFDGQTKTLSLHSQERYKKLGWLKHVK